jgi:hypothetical protein
MKTCLLTSPLYPYSSNINWNEPYLLKSIYSYLSYRDIYQCSYVNSHWRKCSLPLLFKKIRLYKSTISSSLKYLVTEAETNIKDSIAFRSHVKQILLDINFEEIIARQVFQNYSFLTKLTVYKVKLSESALLNTLKPLAYLEQLVFSQVDIVDKGREGCCEEEFRLPKTLTKLYLICTNTIGESRMIKNILSKHQYFHKIIIDDSNIEIIQSILSYYPSLHDLSICQSTDHLTDDEMDLIIKNNPQITHLSLTTDNFRKPTLKLIMHLTQLQLLKLFQFGFRDLKIPKNYLRFERLSHLTTLDCSDIGSLGSKSNQSLMKKRPQITHLKL